jgi:hypothetical protein
LCQKPNFGLVKNDDGFVQDNEFMQKNENLDSNSNKNNKVFEFSFCGEEKFKEFSK